MSNHTQSIDDFPQLNGIRVQSQQKKTVWSNVSKKLYITSKNKSFENIRKITTFPTIDEFPPLNFK
jgi:hypothetical protein